MKLHLLLLPIALAACTSGAPDANTAATPVTPTTATTPAETPAVAPMTLDDATLSRYHWQLAEATDAQGARIDALFVAGAQAVQLDFSGQRLAVSNTCNRMNAGYRLTGEQLQVDAIVGTLMACEDPNLMALDKVVSTRLEGNAGVTLTGSEEAPRLQLTTASGDKLVFDGTANADNRYGGAGEQMFMEVGAKTVPCNNPLMPDKQCLQIREVTFGEDGTRSGTPGNWQPLNQDIQGYTHEAGVRNVLRLKRYAVANPPADGSSIAYVLDMVVESEQVKP